MTSKTKMIELVKTWQAKAIKAGLEDNPSLLKWRDERGRNWLHLAASIDWQAKPNLHPKDSIVVAKHLLAAGLDINEPAFREGSWQATPLWYAVGRGKNTKLAEYFLNHQSTPEHCLWAAGHNDGGTMIKLLLKHGANIEAIAEGETPLLGAVKMSRFAKAEVLLKAGADPDFKDQSGMTALHYMLKKGSDLQHFHMFTRHNAKGDIKDAAGKTARDILLRKRDKGFHEIAERLA